MKKKNIIVICLFISLLTTACSENTGRENTQQSVTTIKEQTMTTTETSETNTDENPITLTEYNIFEKNYKNDLEYNGMEFMTKEQQKVFWLVTEVYSLYDSGPDNFWYDDPQALWVDGSVRVGDREYLHTGYTYESVIESYNSIMSEDIFSDAMKERYADYNGEFVVINGGGGGDPSFTGKIDFQLVSSDDSKLEFKVIAYYADPGTNESLGTQEYNCEMKKIDESWIVTKFEFWC